VSKCCVHAVMAAASKYLLPFKVGVDLACTQSIH
jgi:hypothetical protein